jgi:hypothetical protein
VDFALGHPLSNTYRRLFGIATDYALQGGRVSMRKSLIIRLLTAFFGYSRLFQ